MSIVFSIIIPFKNEQLRLPEALSEIIYFFKKYGKSFELILVDDGSTDDSVAAISKYFLAEPTIRLLTHATNQGKGAAVRTGMLVSSGDYVLFTDADLSTPIHEFEKLFKLMQQGVDVVIGSRCNRDLLGQLQPWYRELPGRFGNIIIRTFLGLSFRDTQCGFKLFTHAAAHSLFQTLLLKRWSFDFEILYRAQRRGMNIIEVPVVWNDKEGSKFRPFIDHLHSFFDLIRLRLWS